LDNMCGVDTAVAVGNSYILYHGGLIHLLLVIAIIVVLIRVIQGRKIV